MSSNRSRRILTVMSALVLAIALPGPVRSAPAPYPWLDRYDPGGTLERRIPPPPGFTRIDAPAGSFAAWLRGLPLKADGSPVRLYNGQRKANQDAHLAVVDIDVGTRDLQQCADAVMRLRAEYLYGRGDLAAIHFKFTSGDQAAFTKYREGYRASIKGNTVRWVKSAKAGGSYEVFRQYLNTVFTYAGTASLSKELKARPIQDMQIGDVFIQGGFPGHAVLVADMARDPKSGRTVYLLVQSYMPAQEMHVLKNPADPSGGAWYELDLRKIVETPEWTFRREDLKGF